MKGSFSLLFSIDAPSSSIMMIARRFQMEKEEEGIERNIFADNATKRGKQKIYSSWKQMYIHTRWNESFQKVYDLKLSMEYMQNIIVQLFKWKEWHSSLQMTLHIRTVRGFFYIPWIFEHNVTNAFPFQNKFGPVEILFCNEHFWEQKYLSFLAWLYFYNQFAISRTLK